MSHTFYMYNDDPYSFVFYYNFDNNVKSNLLSASNGYENTINYVKALDENILLIFLIFFDSIINIY